MRRTSLVLLAAAVAAGPIPAEAARERAATARYGAPSGIGGVFQADVYVNGVRPGVALLHTRKGESRVRVSVVDDTGLPVAFALAYDADVDGDAETALGYWCGTTPAQPLRFKPTRGDLVVYVHAGACGTGASAPTNGTVTAAVS